MLRDNLLAVIADSEAKIIAIEKSTTLSKNMRTKQ
jgi:hypothetical protein